MLSRRILLGSIAAPAVALAAVSLAWACVPQGSFNINPNQGAAGSQVAASGSGFESGPVEIRWESRTGPLLATATGPSFSNVSVTIPASAEPGIHYLSAANTGEHADHSATAVSFEVTGAAAPQPGAPPPPSGQAPAPSAPAPNSPAPTTPAAPVNQGPSRRTVAIRRCKRRFSVTGVKSAARRQRIMRRRRACIRRARRLPASDSSAAFRFASLPLFGGSAAARD